LHDGVVSHGCAVCGRHAGDDDLHVTGRPQNRYCARYGPGFDMTTKQFLQLVVTPTTVP
jgi:hypothetical protein